MAPDPAGGERELEWLREQERRPRWRRALAFLGHGGPGYLQAALTLGGGTASASLFAGAAFGYELLWVAPTGVLLGAVMLAALAHQTLSTGRRPFHAMRAHAGPLFAWATALGALFASVVWHFPQYSLAAALLADLGAAAGLRLPRFGLGLLVLAWAVATAQMYAGGSRWMRRFDRLLQLLVWLVVACFAIVVARTGVDWGAAARGLVPFRVPAPRAGVSGLEVALAGLSAAVVVNMVFLYPYTLRARGWGRAHRSRARYDLAFGLVLPYSLATGLIVIAAANTVHAGGGFSGESLSPLQASRALEAVAGPAVGRVLFDVGVLAMALSTITMHMVCAAFACGEMFGWERGGRAYRLALLLPTPGVLGAAFWSDVAFYVAVPASIACGFLLPLAYLGILRLQRSAAYLGADLPRGPRGALWLGGMIAALLVVTAFLAVYLLERL